MTHEHEVIRGKCRCGAVPLVCEVCQRECIEDAFAAADQYIEEQILASQAALRRVHDTCHRRPEPGCAWCVAARLARWFV